MRLRFPRWAAALVSLAVAAGGCAARSAAESAPQQDLTVVATVFPLAWVASVIAPNAEVTQLGGSGLDPHDLELTPGEQALTGRASVALYMGVIGFMPQVEQLIGDSPAALVDVSEIAGAGRLLTFGDDDHADDDHDRDGSVEPHIWFDAAVMAEVARQTGEVFTAADPDGAEGYRSRAEQAARELEDLDAEIDALLRECRHDEVIVSHEAYAYLLQPRGFRQKGLSGAGGHGEATPQRIADLVTAIEREGIEAVLAEPVEGRQGAEAVAAESGAALIEIYSLDIVTDQQREAGFPQLLREQAEAVARALECGVQE